MLGSSNRRTCGDPGVGRPESEEKMRTARADPPRVSPPIKPNVDESLVSIWCQLAPTVPVLTAISVHNPFAVCAVSC